MITKKVEKYHVKHADHIVDYGRNWLVTRHVADGMAIAACYTRKMARRICDALNRGER